MRATFDNMTAQEVKAYIDTTDPTEVEAQLAGCSFACVKRTYTKYFGFPPVSTMSREYVQSSFRLYRSAIHRGDVLLGP